MRDGPEAGRPRWSPGGIATIAIVLVSIVGWMPAALRLPRLTLDSVDYRKIATAFSEFDLVPPTRPDRLPGYPLFLLACDRMATVLGVPALPGPDAWRNVPTTSKALRGVEDRYQRYVRLPGNRVAAVVQTVLLAGLVPLVVAGIARRTTGSATVGGLAAFLVVTDPDLQRFGPIILTEAIATTFAVLALWLRLHDTSWRRGRWAFAALTFVKPYLAPLPVALGSIDALHQRRLGPLLTTTWPTVLPVALWLALTTLAGGSPREDGRRLSALADFAVVYDANLWEGVVEPADQALLERSKQERRVAYAAAHLLTGSPKPWDPPTDWRPLRRVADAAIAAHPGPYFLARAAIVPYAFTRTPVRVKPGQHLRIGVRWRTAYNALLYGHFPVFVIVVLLALWSGLGWPGATGPMRNQVVVYVVVVFLATAWLSVGTSEVRRLTLVTRPITAILWAALLGHGFSRPRPDDRRA